MWREIIEEASDGCTFAEPAVDEDILAVERTTGTPMPSDLVDLLKECNGVETSFGDELVYSCQQMIEEYEVTRTDPIFRENFMPFDGLLFFARDCGGNLFGYSCASGRPWIYFWDHEEDTRLYVAGSLQEYMVQRLDGAYDESGRRPTDQST